MIALALSVVTAAAPLPNVEQRGVVALNRGLDFLAERQQPDGTWQADERVPTAYTALALRALVEREGPDAERVVEGYDALLAQQDAEGAIYGDLLANYNTAISVSALARANEMAGDGRYDDAIDAGVTYLKRLQWVPGTTPEYDGDDLVQGVEGEDDPFYGGWGYGGRSRGPGRPDLSNAAMSIQAMRDAGLSEDDPAFRRAVTFITRLQNRSESNPNEWAGDDGGFVYGPAGDKQYESFAGEYVTPAGERRLRSYGSMTYAGLKSMIYAGLRKDDPRVTAAFDWVRGNWTLDENPGMADLDPDKARWGHYYYLLMAARALDAYDVPVLETPHAGEVDWRLALIETLTGLQNEDGSWTGDEKWRENDPVLVTAYATAALQAAYKDLEEHPARQ